MTKDAQPSHLVVGVLGYTALWWNSCVFRKAGSHPQVYDAPGCTNFQNRCPPVTDREEVRDLVPRGLDLNPNVRAASDSVFLSYFHGKSGERVSLSLLSDCFLP